MQQEFVSGIQRLLNCYSPALLVGSLDSVRPMNLFARDDTLYAVDQNSESIQSYEKGIVPSITRQNDLADDGANWFANIIPESDQVWHLGRNSKLLTIFDGNLNVLHEYELPFSQGFFFKHQDKTFFLSGFNRPNALFEFSKGKLKKLTDLQFGFAGDHVMGMYANGRTVFLYMDSKQIFTFNGKHLQQTACLNDIQGRLYALRYHSDTRRYVALTCYANNTTLHLYSNTFKLLRIIPLPESPSSGSLCLIGEHTYVGSRQRGYINIYKISY